MKKEDYIKQLKELRAELKELRISNVKGELKDTSSIRKVKKQVAVVLTKLNELENVKKGN